MLKTLALTLAIVCAPVTLVAQNFVGDVPAIIIKSLEASRVRCAKYWFGQALPNWSKPCQVTWKKRDGGAGGKTRFKFSRGEVYDFRCDLQGELSRVVEDAIPHEADHMVRASVIRKPMPRWLDEGAATLFESEQGQAEYRERYQEHGQLLWSELTSKDYRPDAKEYEFGHVMVLRLIGKHGKHKVLDLMRSDDIKADWPKIIGGKPEDLEDHVVNMRPPKNTIYMITAPWCGPCRAFKADLNRAGATPYTIKPIPYNPVQHGGLAIPHFCFPNGRCLSGYSQGWANFDKIAREWCGIDEKLQALDLQPVPPPPKEDPPYVADDVGSKNPPSTFDRIKDKGKDIAKAGLDLAGAAVAEKPGLWDLATGAAGGWTGMGGVALAWALRS